MDMDSWAEMEEQILEELNLHRMKAMTTIRTGCHHRTAGEGIFHLQQHL
ncbi:MAG: hypothetical protein ACLTW9_06175 [Enterocloster sp.]